MRLLIKQNIEDVLFFDIETAAATNNFDENHELFSAWEYDHARNVEDNAELIELYNKTAPLYAEYGRIVTISIGAVRGGELIVKSFSNDDEVKLLEEFNASLDKFANNKTWLCGHNILDFDMPYIMRRCLANGVPLHLLFDTAHLKPWETSVFDTALLWKGTAWKKQSLSSVISAVGLPSPKDDISGADVSRVYYEGGIDRIVKYCEKDVFATANLFRKLRYEKPFEGFRSATTYAEPTENILDYLRNGGDYTDAIKEQLQDSLSKLSAKEKKIAIDILNTIPSRAKGKVTKLTKKHIKELC